MTHVPFAVALIVVYASACGGSKSTSGAAVDKTAALDPAPEWQTVQDWSGSGIKQTESFTTGSREWRIYWKTRNEPFARAGILQITVHQADNDAVVTTAANKQGIGSDVSYVRSPPGRYYLAINSANVDWLVRVEDQRPIVGPPPAPGPDEERIDKALALLAKEEAAKGKVSEVQSRKNQIILFVDRMIRTKVIVAIDEDVRGWYIDASAWRTSVFTQGMKEQTVRRFAEFRQNDKGRSDVVVYDGETGRELASYTPRQGVRIR
jgi:hypothetical protein